MSKTKGFVVTREDIPKEWGDIHSIIVGLMGLYGLVLIEKEVLLELVTDARDNVDRLWESDYHAETGDFADQFKRRRDRIHQTYDDLTRPRTTQTKEVQS